MEISGSTSVVAAASGANQGDAIAISVQKKAMDIQEQQAVQLIESVEESAPEPKTSLDEYA